MDGESVVGTTGCPEGMLAFFVLNSTRFHYRKVVSLPRLFKDQTRKPPPAAPCIFKAQRIPNSSKGSTRTSVGDTSSVYVRGVVRNKRGRASFGVPLNAPIHIHLRPDRSRCASLSTDLSDTLAGA